MPIDFDLDRYLVLRIDGAASAGAPKLQSIDGLSSGAKDKFKGAAPKLTLETTTLTDKQKEAAARDPQQEVAPTIPIALVHPVASESAATHDPVEEAKAAKSSWGIGTVKAAYAIPVDKPPVRDIPVAVLDTGIDKEHPAFRGIKSWQTLNFVDAKDGEINEDVSEAAGSGKSAGHGTHCASTIFGQDVDGVRVGVAPGVTSAIIGKVLDSNGHGSNEALAAAMQWACSKGARIISMSLGFDFVAIVDRLEAQGWSRQTAVSRALQAYRENVRYFDSLIDFLTRDNRLLIAAAGNDSARPAAGKTRLIDVTMPAATRNIISVGAIGRAGAGFAVAPFSNVNPTLSAPGVDIVGAKLGGGLTAMSGTSMACPHVAGLAALWWDNLLVMRGRASAEDVHAHLRTQTVNASLPFADQGQGIAVAPDPTS